MNTAEIELLKKEIAYRASRRGTKELDTVFKPFTNPQYLAQIPPEHLPLIQQMLLETEDALMGYLVEGIGLPEGYTPIKEYLQRS